MKKIENYKEFDSHEKESIKNNIGVKCPIDKNIVLHYLKSGKNAGAVCSMTYDYVMDKRTNVVRDIYTDGTYLWDDAEIYHFDRYDMRLNDDFIQHIKNNFGI